MSLNVIPLESRHIESISSKLIEPAILKALGLVRAPSHADLQSGTAQSLFGQEETVQQVRWWVIELSGRPTWAAIEYGWRGALDASRELDLFRLDGVTAPGEDFLWMLWSLVREVMRRRQTRRIRWQVSKIDEKGRFYRRLGLHELGEFELEGDSREVFELSRGRFERVETELGEAQGRRALLRAWRAALI